MTITALRQNFNKEIRAHILKTARKLLVAGGYGNFSLRSLAKRLDYSPSALYKHFQNKDEIFDCLVEESFAALVNASQSVEDLPGEAPLSRLKRGMQAYVRFGVENPDDYRLAFVLQRPDVSRPAKPRAAYDGLKVRVQKCIDAGCFQKGNVDLMAQSLWATAHGVTSLLIQRPDFPWVGREELIEQAVHGAIAGLVHTKRGEKCTKLP
jgi:AcrR family transcriptional regulator